jgi:hypothetical protein
MITATANYVLYEGSKQVFSALSIICEYKYNPQQETFLITICPTNATAGDTTRFNEYSMLATKTHIDAETSSGTNPSDKLLYQVEEHVIQYLDAITENSAVNFSH